MLTRMTTAWGVGVTNFVVYGVGFLTALCALAAGVSFITSRTFLASLDLAFTLFASFCIVAGTVSWLYGKRVGGRVLLDCGFTPTRNLFLLVAAFYLFSWLWGFTTPGKEPIGEDIQELLFAVFFLFMAFVRLQIRENGIWEYGGLLRWHKLVSYRWADDGTLITCRKGLLTTLRVDLPVPPEQREAVKALLLERAPQAREP